ncbi:MAG: DsbA family protein [Gemmatimonadaceae bacterium]
MSPSQLVVPLSGRDHVAGSLEAPIVLVEYGDFECSYCGRAYPIVKAAQRHFGKDLAVVFRHFPLAEIHPHARLAAEAAEEAGAQGEFWRMHDMLFENQGALEQQDLLAYAESLGLDVTRFARELTSGAHTKRVRDDFRGGVRSGVNGTPTFFINGARYDGDWAESAAFIAALAQMAGSEHVAREG